MLYYIQDCVAFRLHPLSGAETQKSKCKEVNIILRTGAFHVLRYKGGDIPIQLCPLEQVLKLRIAQSNGSS
jgi:hypothetical protein